MLKCTTSASGKVLKVPLLTAIQSTARKPLAFTILDVANCLTTGCGSSNVPGCGARSREIHGSLADRRSGGEKKFLLRDHARLNLWVLNGLKRELRSLAAFSLSFCMANFGGSILAILGLPPGCLPTTHLPQAFGILAITLVPAPRLILAPTSFA